jgi:shikimate kinase/3-dehydroquinate synthase
VAALGGGARSARPAIVLIGFMAAGKTAAAKAIAAELGVEPADADELIEAEIGEPIAAFFEREGEAEFRRREEDLVARLLKGEEPPAVLALGGGALESERVRAALEGHLAVWCRVDEETAWERATRDGVRPLAADRDEFGRRFAAREPAYRAAARVTLPADARDHASAAAPWLAAIRDAPGLRMAWAESAGGAYPAIVGPGALDALGAVRERSPDVLPARAFAVADAAVAGLHPGLLEEAEAVIEVAGGEESKTIAEAERVLGELAAAGARRGGMVLALGGGGGGDLAGFCAATYQRGVPVVQAPTTLVAQVDSAYGGKTGVDLPAAKNYVGAYHQPIAVLADTATLATLPPEELSAGFVEVIKTALIAGDPLWSEVRGLAAPLDPGALGDVIFACAQTKIAVVASDERDGGRRAVLNLGHTVGHAIEVAAGYGRYRHGEAVGLGLLAALRLSGAGGLRDEVAALLSAHGLPTQLAPEVPVAQVVGAIARDKKATSAGVGFVLLERPGEPRWGQPVEPDKVEAAVQELQP